MNSFDYLAYARAELLDAERYSREPAALPLLVHRLQNANQAIETLLKMAKENQE